MSMHAERAVAAEAIDAAQGITYGQASSRPNANDSQLPERLFEAA
jgi:hypothetical protein